MSILRIRDLTMTVGEKQSQRLLLDEVSFDLAPGRITGVAGASGSGKTMTGLSILGLHPEGTELSGSIAFDGIELVGMAPKRLNTLRGADLAMVFQDPSASLHPMLSVASQLTDHVRHHRGLKRKEARAQAHRMLERVHVPDPAGALRKFPHQFSGGQLQRIAIASALMCGPRILIADEPTTALDVTVQAGILRLLRELADDLDLAVLLVTHDFGVLSSVADDIVVMKSGRVVETGDRRSVITAPSHPYTRSLIDALPTAHTHRSSENTTADPHADGATHD